MKGLELSRKYYETYAKEELKNKFPEIYKYLCCGLFGHGSECFSFDDDISKDHDYIPGFLILLPDDIYEEYGFKLTRFYDTLPKEFEGFKIPHETSMRFKYRGVKSIGEFLSYYLPFSSIPEKTKDWMNIDDFYLAELTNGEIYFDNFGVITDIRNQVLNRPNDVRLKKLSTEILRMAQYGQYNYKRCIEHGEISAAITCLSEFSLSAAKAAHLLENKFSPYYKWLFKGLNNFDKYKTIKEKIDNLLSNPLDFDNNYKLIDSISCEFVDILIDKGLTTIHDHFLEGHAYKINDHIEDSYLRNSDIIK